MSSPIYNPPVPYNGPIPGGFLPGRMVRVQGRVNPSANSLTLNLRTGPSSYDDVALHVNPRFNESVIVRNSCMQSSWGSEERHGPPVSIYRDQNFEILIMCEQSAFKIAVNGQHFAEFTHRLYPLDRINHFNVDGDLTISLIQFDGTVTQSTAYSATAPPMPYGSGGSGVSPYPPASAMAMPGFVLPPTGGAAYPSAPGGAGYPPPVGPNQPYGGYPGPGAPGSYYPQQPGAPGGYPQQPGGPYPAQGHPGGPYAPQGQPGGPYAPQGQPGGYYNPGGGGPPPHGSSSGGLLSDASKLLAGGLAGVGLAKVANKIPGLGGGGHHGGHNSYGHHGGGHGGGPLGGILGPAAAMGIGGALAGKGLKKQKKNKMLKYGLPVGGAVLGGYALKKGMKGFHGHGSSSSSSSSSEEE